MRPASVDVLIRNNEDWPDVFKLADPTSPDPHTPIDLDGVALSMHVRVRPQDASALLIASRANGRIIVRNGCAWAVPVSAGGTGYLSAPVVDFSGGGDDEDKVLPTAYARVVDGAVVEVVITEPGQNMTEPPTVAFSGGEGSGAAASVKIGPICAFRAAWAEVKHLDGTYYQDLVGRKNGTRKVFWAGSFTVVHGVTK